MALDTKDTKFVQQCDLWQQVRAAIAGKYAILNIVDSLPAPQYSQYSSNGGESEAAAKHANKRNALNTQRKQEYWSRGRYLNATARTVESLDGMLWANQPEIELPSAIEYAEDNADGAGASLRDVAAKVTQDLTSTGRCGILVDMPSAPIDEAGNLKPLTSGQQSSQEYAPKMVFYKPEQIFYFRKSNETGALEEVRLTEYKNVKKNEFDYESEKYIRRLIMIEGVYHNQLYKDSKLLSDVEVIVNGVKSSEILFQFFGSDNNMPDYSRVTMYDLANLNLGHFVLDCDNRDNLHFHGQGMTNVFTDMDYAEFSDLNPSGLDTGAKGVNLFGSKDKVEITQIEATGAIPSEMERDEKRMIYIGAQLVQDNNSNQTLGAKEIEVNSSMSTLKKISYNATAGLEKCLNWMSAFLGGEQNSLYRINTEFVTDTMDAQTLALHFQTVQGGLMPKEEYWEAARKRGLTNRTNEELKEAILEDDLDLVGESEEIASLRAENEALKSASE